MSVRLSLGSFAVIAVAMASFAQGDGPKAVKPAASKITAVTVYQTTALVTREAAAPDGAGIAEIVVSPLPPTTVQSSLYAEGTDGIRILSARFRTRAIAEDTREEVRKVEAKIKTLKQKMQSLQSDLKAGEQNAAFVAKLEGFTAATLTHLTDKGQLDSEKTIALATFIRETRTKAAKEEVTTKQLIEATQEELSFNERVLGEKSGGVARTERDAVIVIDKTKPGAGTIRLNYLVSAASWKAQYKLRAGTKDKDPVSVEYLASVCQQTGEDWSDVNLVLSTAQPLLNAAPPDLRTLEIAVGPAGQGLVAANEPTPGSASKPNMPPASAYVKDLEKKSQSLRAQAQEQLNNKDLAEGGKNVNDAAALEQYRDLLITKETVLQGDAMADSIGGGPSVTFHLKTKLSLPSRSDEQVLEIAKLDLTAKFYYKAVPVLTPHVYRLADLINTTDYILLPGEATAYLGTDFVGQTNMPLVAIGKPFTVGFGADPQVQVSRKLMDKTRTTQGGNQVLTFKYRILLSSYKTTPIDVQVWDRMPHAEAANAIAVTMVKGETDLSKDPLYVRDERPKNLLRWDMKLDPKQNGEKALAIEYENRIEFDRTVNIGAFLAK